MNSLETVFEWLLAATLRASVLVVVILCIQLVLRRWLPAAWRHALWLPMLAVLVLPVLPEAPFALSPKTSPVPAPVSAAPISAEIKFPDALPMAPANAAVFTPIVAAPVAPVKVNFLAIAWLAGAGIVLAAGGIGYHRNLRRIRMNASSPDRLLQITLAETALEAGLKRAPSTVISPAVASPAVTGLIRPVLLLPAGFPAGFSTAEARLILLHEFTHLKRLDLPLNWLMCVLQAMHWFNPLLWFAFARMRADRESACDARVLSIDASDRRAEYGGALLKLQCVTPTRALSLGFVGIFERDSEIKSRIREISTHRRTRLTRQIAGGVIVTLLMTFGVTKGQQESPPSDASKTVKEDSDKTKHSEIIINILKDGKIRVEGQELRDQELTARIDTALKKFPDHPFRIKAAGEVKYQDVVRVIDLCQRAGAWNLSFATGEPKNPANALIQNKLNTIIIPTIDFVDVSVEDAIEFLRVRAAQLDVGENDPLKKGINFVIRNPRNAAAAAAPAPMIRGLRLRNVSLGAALKEICEQANLSYTVEENSIVIAPKNAAGAIPAVPAKLADADAARTAIIQNMIKSAGIQIKLKSITIPRIDFQETSLEDAIDFLRVRAAELDVTEQDPAKKGINFVIRNPHNGAVAAAPAPMIRELRLRNVPLATALKYICDQTKLQYTVEDTGVILSPQDENGTQSAIAADPADVGRDSNAARIGTLSQITSQVGKYPHPTGEFFKSACLLTELQRILGPDYQAYREHLSRSGAGMLEKEGDYVCGDVSQLHVGGYRSLFYVDPKNEKMYLFWLKKTVAEKDYQIYGDGPIPAAILASIANHMNATWGHVASFRFDGERLLFEAPKEK